MARNIHETPCLILIKYKTFLWNLNSTFLWNMNSTFLWNLNSIFLWNMNSTFLWNLNSIFLWNLINNDTKIATYQGKVNEPNIMYNNGSEIDV